MLGEDDHNEIDNEPINAEDLFADLEEGNNLGEGQDNENNDAQGEGDDTTTPAGEEPQRKKTRQINRLPNLNENWLVDSRRENIRHVNGYFEKMKFKKGKGQERENLKMILQRYEYFGQNCYPKLCFTDFVEKVEYVSGKRTIKHVLQDIRQGRDLIPSDSENENEDPVRDIEDPIPNVPSANNSPSGSPEKPKSPPSDKPKSVMTDEMKEMIRKKREEALAKRQQRLNESMNDTEIAPKDNLESNGVVKESSTMNSNNLDSMSEDVEKSNIDKTDFVIEKKQGKTAINENEPKVKTEAKEEQNKKEDVEREEKETFLANKESDIVENVKVEKVKTNPDTENLVKESEKKEEDDIDMEVDS